MNKINSLDFLLEKRFSCRAFLPKRVSKKIIEKIVSSAQKVPSWCNAQPWKLLITAGAKTDHFRNALFDAASNFQPAPDLEWPTNYSGVYGERRRTCGYQLYDAVGIKKGDRTASLAQMMENYRLFGAPHVAIVTSPSELGTYGAMDTGGFVTAFCLAAQAYGIASIQQAAIAAQAPFVRTFFKISDDQYILCAISFGYSDLDHPANSFRTERASVGDVIEWHE